MDGDYTALKCPDTYGGTTCGATWPYEVVRSAADLNEADKRQTELRMGEDDSRKECPACGMFCFNKDGHTRVGCGPCKTEFCWICLQPWQSTGIDICGNNACQGQYSTLMQANLQSVN